MPRTTPNDQCHKSDCYSTELAGGWQRWATQAEFDHYLTTGDVYPWQTVNEVTIAMQACAEHVYPNWADFSYNVVHDAECPCPESACPCELVEPEGE